MKLQMLKPRVKILDTNRVPMLKAKRAPRPSGRDADPRRTLPLNKAAWQKLRASVLAEEPLCRECARAGIVTPATDLDHGDNNPGNNDRENLVPLCHPCHGRKTMHERHGTQRPSAVGVDGWPTDPSHRWNTGVVEPLLKRSRNHRGPAAPDRPVHAAFALTSKKHGKADT